MLTNIVSILPSPAALYRQVAVIHWYTNRYWWTIGAIMSGNCPKSGQIFLKSAGTARKYQKLIFVRGYRQKILVLTKFNTFYESLLNFNTFIDCLSFQFKIPRIAIVVQSFF